MENKRLPSGQKRVASIDWKEIYRRLEMGQLVLQQKWDRSPEEKKNILRARARDLAQEAKTEKAAQESLEIAEFVVAYETYGIESSYIREIYPLKELTPVPCTPAFVLGIINVRGQILSVIDIKKFFDLPEKGLTDLNKVIIVQGNKLEFGILADVVLGVRKMPIEELQPPLPTLTGIRAEYLKGVTKERVVVLDVEKLLSDEKMVVNEEMNG